MFNNHCIIDGFYTQYYRIKAILFLVIIKRISKTSVRKDIIIWIEDWLIEWIRFYTVSAIFLPYNGVWQQNDRCTHNVKNHPLKIKSQLQFVFVFVLFKMHYRKQLLTFVYCWMVTLLDTFVNENLKTF